MQMPPNFPGFLIALEGIDGTGKSTQVQLIDQALSDRKFVVVRTKEPTEGPWGRMLRDSATKGRFSIEEEVEAFIKDRREHVEQKIKPALRKGQVVVIDRYYFSTAAYQGARGLDPDELIRRNEEFAPEPDLLVLLDLAPEGGLDRIKARGDRANHFENTIALERARAIFRAIKKPYLLRVDASQPPEMTRDLIIRQFSALYAERIARSNAPAEEKLRVFLGLFGGL